MFFLFFDGEGVDFAPKGGHNSNALPRVEPSQATQSFSFFAWTWTRLMRLSFPGSLQNGQISEKGKGHERKSQNYRSCCQIRAIAIPSFKTRSFVSVYYSELCHLILLLKSLYERGVARQVSDVITSLHEWFLDSVCLFHPLSFLLASSGFLPVNITFPIHVLSLLVIVDIVARNMIVFTRCISLHSLHSLEVTLDITDPDAAKNLGFGHAIDLARSILV